MEKEFCNSHEEQIKAVSKMETQVETHGDQIDILFEERKKTDACIAAIHLTMKEMKNVIEQNFYKQSVEMTTLKNDMDRKELAAQDFRVKVLSGLQIVEIKIKEFDDFSWFRKKINWMKDNLPWFVTYAVMLCLLVIVIAEVAGKSFWDVFKIVRG